MDEKLTIGEAAKRYAVSSSAIRRLIDSGKVKSTRDGAGRHMVHTGDLTGVLSKRAPASRSGALANKTSSARSDEPSGEATGTTDRYLRAIETALDHERRVSEDLRTQNRELQSQLVKLAAEMQAILARDGDGKLSRWFRR
jgi:excisionase family DNA binding protein